MKFDMHCHTQEGSLDGKIPVADVYKRQAWSMLSITIQEPL